MPSEALELEHAKKKESMRSAAVGEFKTFVKHQENGTHAFECCTEN